MARPPPAGREGGSLRTLVIALTAVGVCGEPIENLCDRYVVSLALAEPLPIGEARPRHLAHELNVPATRRPFGHFDHRGPLPCVAPGGAADGPVRAGPSARVYHFGRTLTPGVTLTSWTIVQLTGLDWSPVLKLRKTAQMLTALS